jgi:hypothetical protein
MCTILSFVEKPSRPGTLNFLLNEPVADPTVAIPARVTTSHAIATIRL